MKSSILLAATLLAGTNAFAEWKAAPCTIPTPWGEKITPENAWREYPRPNLVRKNWTNLNGLWNYAVQPKEAGVPEKWQGEILVPFCIESSLSGVGRLLEPSEQLWYRRSFDVQPEEKGRLLLHFGAVDYRTQVFVNGVEATDAPHLGGNTPFTVDITEFVKPGGNELTLCVWDPTEQGYQPLGKQILKPHGCFYTRVSGIWQTVWLERVPEAWIAGYKVVTDIDKGEVSVTLDAKGDLYRAGAKVEIFDGGKVVSAKEATSLTKPVVLPLPAAKLWSPETPNLYDLRLTLSTPNATDEATGYFGMRKMEIRKDEAGVLRFYLNNQKTYLLGTLDQGWWPDGLLTPPSDEAMAWDIMLLKKAGFNCMRKHIKVEPMRYYYLCDKLGIMLWQDQPSSAYHGRPDNENRYGNYRRELREMMELLQPIPSIVIWVPYNEGWGQPKGAKTNQTLAWAKRFDPTRPVNAPSGWVDYGFGDMIDMHKYPGPQMHPVSETRASVLGEFGGIGYTVKGHCWSDKGGWGYVSDSELAKSFSRYRKLMEKLAPLASYGLAASIYTQTTDVENELNGLATYDRKVIKYSTEELAALHKTIYDAAAKTKPCKLVSAVLDSKQAPHEWSYTTSAPAAEWTKLDFDDSAWAKAPAGFGNGEIAKNSTRTKWDGAIWLRQTFEWDGAKADTGSLFVFWDEDAKVYLNGELAADLPSYTTRYEDILLNSEQLRRLLRKGKNVIAVSAKNKLGGAYIDLGLNIYAEK